MAAATILQVTAGRTREEYSGDIVLRSAVERQFQIVGEALVRIARHDPETAARIGEHPKIIAFRNILVHQYDEVDDVTVWRVIQEEVPKLHALVEVLIREVDEAT